MEDRDLPDAPLPEEHYLEEYREDGSRRTLAIIIIIILLLLMLFGCPVDKSGESRVDPDQPGATADPPRKYDETAKYSVSGGDVVYHIGERYAYSKSKIVILRYKVRNVTDEPQVFDNHLVSVVDEGGRQYPANRDLSMDYYEEQGDEYFLPVRLKPKASKRIISVFNVERAARGLSLVGRSFDAKIAGAPVPVPTLAQLEEPMMAPMRRTP